MRFLSRFGGSFSFSCAADSCLCDTKGLDLIEGVLESLRCMERWVEF